MNNRADIAKTQTVIAARPGVIRQALKSILALVPQIEIIGVVGGGLSALNVIRKHKPALVIIDSELLEDEIALLLQSIKREQPAIRCVVLSDTAGQQQALLSLGADAVLLHREPTERLVEALNNIVL